jgi:adenylate cyclase
MRLRYSHPKSGAGVFANTAAEIVIGRPFPGRHVDLDLTPDEQVSRPHARIVYEHGAYWIEDLDSKHGTWVDGQRITARTRLAPGATVRVGQTLIEVQTEAGARIRAVELEREAEGAISAVIDAVGPMFAAPSEGAPEAMLGQARRQLQAFYQVSQALGSAATVERLLQLLIEQLQRAIPQAQRGAVLLCGERGEWLLKVHWPPGAHAVSTTLAARACAERQAFIWTAAGRETDDLSASVTRLHVQAAIYAPLLWAGEALGVACVDNYATREAFGPADLELISAIANQAAMFVKTQALQQEHRREASLRSNLLRQFSPKIAERLLQERGRLRLGGWQADPVTILVSDVRGFTALSAELEPGDVVQMLNDMFGACIPIIFSYDGTVDKYVGDAILAVFGSPEPDDEQWAKAVSAGLAMQQAIGELGDTWRRRGLPVGEVGIGIHSGGVVHGFIGSPERMEYTVIGDTVNRAARYCDGAGRGEVVISNAVLEHVFARVEVVPKTIKTKHPETEPDLEAYVVTRWIEGAR